MKIKEIPARMIYVYSLTAKRARRERVVKSKNPVEIAVANDPKREVLLYTEPISPASRLGNTDRTKVFIPSMPKNGILKSPKPTNAIAKLTSARHCFCMMKSSKKMAGKIF